MIRILITTLLAGTCAFAQTPGTPSHAPLMQPPAPTVGQQQFNPDNVAPNAPVVTIHGICPKDSASSKTGSAKSDSCQTVITKEQFNRMLSGMNIAVPISNPAAMRSFAESYSQLLALASEGEKAGAENDPRYQELLRIARDPGPG